MCHSNVRIAPMSVHASEWANKKSARVQLLPVRFSFHRLATVRECTAHSRARLRTCFGARKLLENNKFDLREIINLISPHTHTHPSTMGGRSWSRPYTKSRLCHRQNVHTIMHALAHYINRSARCVVVARQPHMHAHTHTRTRIHTII